MEDTQRYAETGDQQNFHSALKHVYGPTYHSLAPVRSSNGTTLLVRKKRHPTTMAAILQQTCSLRTTFRTRENLKHCLLFPKCKAWLLPHTFAEMLQVITSLKNTKCLGTDGIPGKVWKTEGTASRHKVHQLKLSIWDAEDLPQHLQGEGGPRYL